MMNRLYWIDSLKFFGIYLVVLGHCTFLTEKLDMFIYLFHMPLFYLISGFLSHKDKRDFSEILRSSVKRFLVPYFFLGFSVGCGGSFFLMNDIQNCSREMGLHSLNHCLPFS